MGYRVLGGGSPTVGRDMGYGDMGGEGGSSSPTHSAVGGYGMWDMGLLGVPQPC